MVSTKIFDDGFQSKFWFSAGKMIEDRDGSAFTDGVDDEDDDEDVAGMRGGGFSEASC